jgi:hypothetical protein
MPRLYLICLISGEVQTSFIWSPDNSMTRYTIFYRLDESPLFTSTFTSTRWFSARPFASVLSAEK